MVSDVLLARPARGSRTGISSAELERTVLVGGYPPEGVQGTFWARQSFVAYPPEGVFGTYWGQPEASVSTPFIHLHNPTVS